MFQQNFEQLHASNKYIPAENEIRKNKNSKDFLLNTKQVFKKFGKFGKFIWRIWKIKSLASSLNLCPLNQLAQVTTMEAPRMNHRSSH